MGYAKRWTAILWVLFTVAVIACSAAVPPPPGFKKIYKRSEVAANSEEAGYYALFEERLVSEAPPQFKLDDGDVVICVNVSNQLSLVGTSNPTVPFVPTETPLNDTTSADQAPIESLQLSSPSNQTCPPGTYPHLKSSAYESPQAFEPPATLQPVHEHAYGYLYRVNRGIQLSINLWSPYVEKANEFSLAQLWLIASDGGTTSTIEAGWQVYRDLYGDYRPRLFVYWTTDNYQRTGCYNLKCPGFVQTSNKIVVGQAVGPLSVLNGQQYILELLVFKDVPSNRWWLRLGTEYVGYWPGTLFTNSLRDRSSLLETGGEIFSFESSTYHTATDMGSGVFPGSGAGRSAFIRNIQYVDLFNTLYDATGLSLASETPNCYRAGGDTVNPTSWGVHFYFGGPGRSTTCTGV